MAQPLLALPITPEQANRLIIPDAMALLPARCDTPRAHVMMLVITLQESALADRRQGSESRPGPARGLGQFELSGVRGVIDHVASRDIARRVCKARGVAFDARAIHLALEHDDVLAFVFVRLLLLTDPKPLPQIGDRDGARAYYLRNWRPGAARTPAGLREIEARWSRNYPQAVAAVAA